MGSPARLVHFPLGSGPPARRSRRMCERLGELRKTLGDVAAGFDAALLTVSDAAQAVRDASAIEKIAATLKALAAARVADTEYWAVRGNRSPAHALAKESGTSVTQASD